jgi:peptidyl-prolyl cis-trans isomerase C/foldase protein PrsA
MFLGAHRALWVGACGLALLACSPKPQARQDPTVIAVVNGEPVARAEFEAELGREAMAMEGTAPRSPEQMEPFKRTLLDTMVERVLVLQAARTAGVTVTPEEVDRRMLALASEYPAGTFAEALARSNTSRQELERRTHDELVTEKLFADQVFSRVAVTEDQIRRAYDERADEFQEPELVHAQQIVVKGLDEAKRLQQLLWQGKKFTDLARRYSLSPDARVGGDLGSFPRGTMPPAFDETVFKLGVGQVSEVVSTDYGFHLFKVIEKKPARKKELAEVRPELEKKLVAEMREVRQREYVDGLKKKADLKVNDETLQAATGRALPPGPPAEP